MATEREKTATHEAAHAVMAWTSGYFVSEVSIIPKPGEYEGRCQYAEIVMRDAHPFIAAITTADDRRALMCLAGVVSEAIEYGAPMPAAYPLPGDLANAFAVLRRCVPARDLVTHFNRIRRSVAELLRVPLFWRAVTTVKEALLQMDVMSGAWLETVLRPLFADLCPPLPFPGGLASIMPSVTVPAPTRAVVEPSRSNGPSPSAPPVLPPLILPPRRITPPRPIVKPTLPAPIQPAPTLPRPIASAVDSPRRPPQRAANVRVTVSATARTTVHISGTGKVSVNGATYKARGGTVTITVTTEAPAPRTKAR